MSAIRVVAGILRDVDGRILIQRRHEGTHQGGLWEFPGGKMGDGESPESALVRELAEELGVSVLPGNPLLQVTHDYGDRRVLLQVHDVEAFAGTVESLEGQPLRWVWPRSLSGYPMPAADRPIVEALLERESTGG